MAVAIFAGFDWDQANREKCRQHGVSLQSIESAFERDIAVFPDPLHSAAETRYKAIGTTAEGRHMLIVFTLRNRGDAQWIRPISARYMHAKEVRYYAKEAAKTAER